MPQGEELRLLDAYLDGDKPYIDETLKRWDALRRANYARSLDNLSRYVKRSIAELTPESTP